MTTAHELLSDWAVQLRQGRLTIPRCDECDAWNWYPRNICTTCGSDRRSLRAVRPYGHVHTWTRVHRALPPVQHLPVPYLLAIVELDDAPGVRVPCRALDPDRRPVDGEAVVLGVGDGSEERPFLTFAPLGQLARDGEMSVDRAGSYAK